MHSCPILTDGKVFMTESLLLHALLDATPQTSTNHPTHMGALARCEHNSITRLQGHPPRNAHTHTTGHLNIRTYGSVA